MKYVLVKALLVDDLSELGDHSKRLKNIPISKSLFNQRKSSVLHKENLQGQGDILPTSIRGVLLPISALSKVNIGSTNYRELVHLMIISCRSQISQINL